MESHVTPPHANNALRARLADLRAAAGRALDAGEGGLAICHRVSDGLDAIVRELFAAAVRDADFPGAIFATGGWGRRETCPWSDIDLLFLTKHDVEQVRAVADRVLYPLWDAGLEVGHAVRTLDEASQLVATDLATTTALLDARPLGGDATLARELPMEIVRALARRGDPNAFVKRLIEEKQARHARFGDSLFLLEPNLKHGKGALRDLATGLWAARARWRVKDFGDLLPLGQASARQVAVLTTARDFLLRVRAAAQLAHKRRQDQLTFELQEELAPRFYPDARPAAGDVRPAVAPAVEELMRRYYLHAKAVVRESDRLLERAIIPPQRAPHVRPLVQGGGSSRGGGTPPVDKVCIAFNGQVSAADPKVFRERPGEIVRLHRVALDHGLPIYGHTKELLAELVVEHGSQLASDAGAKQHFVALLTDERDARVPSLLEEMHELGILAAIMPEFAPCTGRVQHDLYHVFTVDQHQLYAVALLKQIARGDHPRQTPHAAYRQLRRKIPVYLGTLLHDVGKPLGKGHSDKGAKLAASIARRLGLSDEDRAATEFLVRQHLVMSHLSQRRDLNDAAMIGDFARAVKDEETLRELYLLTYCDTSMTAPGNMTEWKAMLLDQLYEKTLAFFRRGGEAEPSGQDALIARRKQRVGELLKQDPDRPPLADWLAGLPDRYLASLTPGMIQRHALLTRARGDRPCVLDVIQRPKKGFSEVALVAADTPGFLARCAGVMLANRIDIIGAQISSRAAVVPGEIGEALDVFYVRDRYGRAIPPADARWQRVEDDLAAVLTGKADVDALVAARREQSTLKKRKTPDVPTEIEIDNDVASQFTVVDVFTQDRLGVLYAITRTLARLGLDVALSKVATEADRVADVFYVRDETTGAKIVDPARLAAIKDALRAALAEI